MKVSKKINWSKVFKLFVIYFSIFCSGCFFAVMMEYGINKDIIAGFILCLLLIVLAKIGIREGEDRKAELFDNAMNYIYSTLEYDDELTYEETLEEIGFTEEEIKETLKDIYIFNDAE